MNNAIYTRHLDIIPDAARQGKSITIIGAGAIGSWTALSLAKMGFTDITVVDYDTVDIVNVGNQLYGEAHVGKPKVEALAHIINVLSGVKIKTVQSKMSDAPMCSICIVAVDNMKTRKDIYDSWCKNKMFDLGIDPRMGAENLLMYRYTKDKAFGYEHTLYTDEEALRDSCTAKATVYTASLIAGLICKAVKDHAVGADGQMTSVMWNVKENASVINKEM